MEALFHYLWKNRMFGRHVATIGGETVEIIHPGIHNTDAGPDFFNSRLKFLNGEEWVGNVEIHVRASDWYRHNHDKDTAYDNIILHVVGVNDMRIKRSDGTFIPQTCVSPPQEFYERYATMVESMDAPRCLPFIYDVPELNRHDHIDSLGIERLQAKASYLLDILKSTNSNWQQTLFIAFARSLGFGLNSIPFELLAKSIPLNFLMRHADHPEQIEAIFFGQAGFLDPSVFQHDDYYRLLCREYEFLRKKYLLRPIEPGLWKYSRTRPGNFPHRRIAILAAMAASGLQFRDIFAEAKGDAEILSPLFSFPATAYWKTHFNFGETSESTFSVSLSTASIELILINAVSPFYYAYASSCGTPETAEYALNLLNSLKPEKNFITRTWSEAGLSPKSAFESQALIQLTREYCEKNRCLECRFGQCLLRRSLKEK